MRAYRFDEIRRFPLLEASEEYRLAKRWRDAGDRAAAHRIITSHLRLVVKIATGYRGYGFPVVELVGEGNLGLIRAVDHFDPDRGVRFSTYATWWIRARIQEYILRSWSMVRIGTTASQRRIFFNLRKLKSRLSAMHEGDLRPHEVKSIAVQLGVAERDVIDMDRRIHGDLSLNAPVGGPDKTGEWQDWLVDDQIDQEHRVIETFETSNRRLALLQSLSVLNSRERRILEARRLAERPAKLEELASEFGISCERVRQVEVRAFEKLRRTVVSRIAEIQRPCGAGLRLQSGRH